MKNKISIFTDGSSLGNPGVGGHGAVIVYGEEKVVELGGKENQTTNNRMEMMSALSAIKSVAKIDDAVLEINTDSAYLLNGITKWVFGWQKNGWVTSAKEEVLNKDLWQELISVTQSFKGKILWNKVKGHDGIVLNERADHIATSYAEGDPVDLFEGSWSDYQSIMKEEEIRAKKNNSTSGNTKKKTKNNGPAYSYVSMVDGKIETHKIWKSCEERVRGAKGALFKKVMNEKEESDLIKEFKNKKVQKFI